MPVAMSDNSFGQLLAYPGQLHQLFDRSRVDVDAFFRFLKRRKWPIKKKIFRPRRHTKKARRGSRGILSFFVKDRVVFGENVSG